MIEIHRPVAQSVGRFLGLCLVLGGLVPAALHGQLEPEGPRFQVNLATEGDQIAPAIALAGDGSGLAAWIDRGRAVVARRLGIDGPVGAEIAVAPAGPERRVEGVAAASRPGGGWLVAWSEDTPDGPEAIYLRALDGDGTVAGPATRIGQGGGRTLPRLAVDDGDRVVVTWAPAFGGTGYARFLDRDGTPVGGTMAFPRPPTAVGTTDGFLLAWSRTADEVPEVGGTQVVTRPFDATGSPLGPPQRIDGPGDAVERRLSLARDPVNGLLISWRSERGTPKELAVLARPVDASGAPRGAIVRLDVDRTFGTTRPVLAAIPGVGFVASWTGSLERPGGRTVYGVDGRFVDGAGHPRGPELELYRDEQSVILRHDLAGGGGALTLVWASCHPREFVFPGDHPCVGGDDGDAFGIFALRFRTNPAGELVLLPGPRVIGEDGVAATIQVERLSGSDGVVTVDVATGESAGPDSATPGRDFEQRFETLVWGDGDDTPHEVRVPLLEDSAREPDEVFTVEVSNPTGGSTLGRPSRVDFTIVDDDGAETVSDVPFTVRVGPEASRCAGERLAGLLERLGAEAPGTSKPIGINLSVSPSGDFAGLATTGNGPGTAEHHLAFSTNPEATTLLRNPARPQLVTVGFTRNRLASDLVGPGAADLLRLVLDPTLSGNTDPAPEAFLRVDNVEREAGGRPSDAKPGRGLLKLSEPCPLHLYDQTAGRLGPGDAHALRLLQKIVRAETPGAPRQEIAVYPAPDRGRYRIDVRPHAADGSSLGVLAATISVEGYQIPSDPEDPPVLTIGELRGLPLCSGSSGGPQPGEACTRLDRATTLQLVRPRFSGELWEPTPYRILAGPESSGGTVEVDFVDLLADTTWRSPSSP